MTVPQTEAGRLLLSEISAPGSRLTPSVWLPFILAIEREAVDNLREKVERLEAATDEADRFIRKYGLANTSGEKHAARTQARNAALDAIALARLALLPGDTAPEPPR